MKRLVSRSLVLVTFVPTLTAACRSEAPHVPPPTSEPSLRTASAPAPAVSSAPAVNTPPAPSAGPAAAPSVLLERIDELDVVSDDHFWLAADGRVFETRDGGVTLVDKTPARDTTKDTFWSVVASAIDVYLLRDEEAGEASMPLFVSKDGGSSFAERSVPRLEGGRQSRLQRGPTAGSLLVLRSDGGGMNSHSTSILETRDGGATFKTLGTVTGYGAITFQTATTWWSVGTCCASASSVYRSLDAGRTWKVVKESSDKWEPRSDYVFLDSSRGYRVVSDGIERTTNGGKTMSRSPMPEGADTVVFIDANVCVLSASSGLTVSRDMGLTFTSLPSAPLPRDHSVIQIGRAPHGWILTSSAWTGARHTQALVFTLADGATSWKKGEARIAVAG